MLTSEDYRHILVAAIQAQGANTNITELIEETVDATLAVDLKLTKARDDFMANRQAQRDKGETACSQKARV